jgi:hypothetical protein
VNFSLLSPASAAPQYRLRRRSAAGARHIDFRLRHQQHKLLAAKRDAMSMLRMPLASACAASPARGRPPHGRRCR